MKKIINKKDFSYESFPKTRKEQYFQIIKDNIILLTKLGLFCLLFLLPFLFAFFFKEAYLTNLSNETSFTLEHKQEMYVTIDIIFNAIYVICIMVFFIGLGGILKILRRLIWNEPVFFKDDFILGIKENWAQFILIGFLIGLLNFICILLYHLVIPKYNYIVYIIASISLAVVIPILLLSGYLTSIYKNKFKVSLNVSNRLFLRRGFLFILPLLIIYALYFVSLIPIGTIYITLIYIVLFIFLLPLILLMSYILTIKILDDYINIYYYPDKAYLGLYISEEKQKEIDEKVNKANQANINEGE